MKDFEYAKTRKKNRHDKWYMIHTKHYSFCFLVLPLFPIVWLYDHIRRWISEKRVWEERKAKHVLDYMLPHLLNYNNEKDYYYYRVNACAPLSVRKAPFLYRKWSRKFDYQLKWYLIDNYEREGYKKEISKNYDDTYIKFFKKV